jgi:uncharacterized membrane protein SpoIIM required for sporulation
VAREVTRFEELIERSERLARSALSFDEIRELGRLYRRHAGLLARSRAQGDDPDAIRSLNALCVRAYAFLYGVPSSRKSRQGLLAEPLSVIVGRTWHVQVIAWLLLAIGILLGAGLCRRDPRALAALMPETMGYSAELSDRLVESAAARERFLEHQPKPAAFNFFFGSALFAHNTRVGVLAFACGILAGVPTVLLQLYNGLVLGAFSWVFVRDPMPVEFFAWILPHAIPELTAITLFAAAGLLLGEAVAAPGARTRRRAFEEARDPVLLLIGVAVPLLFLAALVESFVRESALSTSARLAVAAAILFGLSVLFWAARRLSVPGERDAAWLMALMAPGPNEAPDSDSGLPS